MYYNSCKSPIYTVEHAGYTQNNCSSRQPLLQTACLLHFTVNTAWRETRLNPYILIYSGDLPHVRHPRHHLLRHHHEELRGEGKVLYIYRQLICRQTFYYIFLIEHLYIWKTLWQCYASGSKRSKLFCHEILVPMLTTLRQIQCGRFEPEPTVYS